MTESDVAVLIERLDNLKYQLVSYREQTEKDEITARVWRESFGMKVDSLQTALNLLPCPTRLEAAKGVKTQLSLLWTFLLAMLAWMKWGPK